MALVVFAREAFAMIHFGLTAYASYVLYATGVAAVVLSIVWRPVVGIYYLVPIIPLQTVRYWMNDFPLGQSVIDILILAVIAGLLLRGERPFPKTPLDSLLLVYAIYTFLSLCAGSLYLRRPLPLSLDDPRLAYWKSYMTMPVLFYLVAATVRNRRQIFIVIMLMCVAVFVLDHSLWDTTSQRDYSHFSEDLRDEGSLGYAGVNGLAAFEAQFATLLLALCAFERRAWCLLAYVGLAVFSALCLMYTLSRGGYAAFLVGYLFVAVVRERKLLIVLVLILSFWSAAAPNAVKERISTIDGSGHQELDHSAQTRVALWNDALGVVKTNPLLGTGFNTYMYMGRIGAYEDTHNIYVSVLLQTGFVGLGLFLLLLWNLGRLGWQAYQRADDPFVRALGLGLAGWIICTSVANVFGDRWTYLQVNGYLWVLAACAWRGITERQAHPVAEMTPNAVDRRQMLLAPQAAV